MPVVIYFVFNRLWPSFGLGALLLAAISTGVVAPFISNLVIVFSAQFFGPVEATLGAVCMFPFFGLVVPLKMFRRWRSQSNVLD